MSADHPTVSIEIDFDTDLAGGVGYHEQVAPSGPYAYYRLKETSGTFADASGNGHTGTGAGTVDYNETSGNPVSGDATARYVLLTTDTTRIGLTGVVPQLGQITVEAFVYVTSLAVDRFVFENDGVAVGGGVGAGSILEFWIETTGALSARAGNSATIVSSTAGDVVINTWYHLAAVFDAPARTISLYKNGALLTSAAWETSGRSSTSLSKLNTSWHWGTDSSSSKGSVHRIAEPAVYLRALPLAEFADHYAARLVPPFAGYTFTDVTDDVLFGDGLRRSFGRASELDDVVTHQTEFTLRNDDRKYEVEYEGVFNLATNPTSENATDPALGRSAFGGGDGTNNAGISTDGNTGNSYRLWHAASGILAIGEGVQVVNADGNRMPVGSSAQYTASLFVAKGNQGATPARGKLQILEYNGSSTLIQTTESAEFLPPNASPTGFPGYIPQNGRVSLTVTTQATTATIAIRWIITTAGNGTGERHNVDDVMLAVGPLMDYFDGRGSGAFWSQPSAVWQGTAHESISQYDGPHFPNIVPGRPCRVTMTQNATTYDWAFGFIEDWPQQWDRAGKFCRVPIRATCFLERLNEEDIGVRDFPEQAAGARLTTLLNAAGHPTSMRDIDTGANTLMALVADTNTVGAHARAIARTDRGLFYIATNGDATFQDGDHRTTATRSTVSQGDLGDDIPYSAPEFHAPKNRIRNIITLRRPGGIDQTVTDQQSINQHGKKNFSDEIMLTTDALVLTRAQDLLAAFKDPHRRIQAITFNPATPPGFWEHALGVQLSDRYTWVFRPEQGSSVTTDVFVEGVVDSYANLVYTSKWFLSVA